MLSKTDLARLDTMIDELRALAGNADNPILAKRIMIAASWIDLSGSYLEHQLLALPAPFPAVSASAGPTLPKPPGSAPSN